MFTWTSIRKQISTMFTGLFKDYLTCEIAIQLSLKQMYFKGLVLGPAYFGHWIDSNLKMYFAYVVLRLALLSMESIFN